MAISRWITYFRERFPLPVYLLLGGGFAVSGALLIRPVGIPAVFSVVASFFGILVFFALLRLMDERKDYEKDLIAHPERPLPRGLLRVGEVTRAIQGCAIGMAVYAFFVGYFLNPAAGMSYLVLTGYLWLMYREFYLGEWLLDRTLLYAVTHQLVLVILCTFAVFAANGDSAGDPRTWQFGFLVLGSFFSYEVCRKLDPRASPLLKTYRSIYGVTGTFLIILVASGIACAAAYRLGLKTLLWPASGALVLSYLLFVRTRYKIVEAVAALSLALHLWAVALFHFKETL